MFSQKYLSARRCARDLAGVLNQVEWRVGARSPMVLNESSAGWLLLWTILRGERTFLVKCLEQLGIDMWALTRDLDDLINQRNAEDSRTYNRDPVADSSSWSFQFVLYPLLCTWLDWAQQQASALHHGYLGTEHLLLAILVGADRPLASLLLRHGIDHDKVRAAVLEEMARNPVAAELVPEVAQGPTRPFLAGWDRPAVGVPRRFSLAMLMMMITLYAVLFATMQVMRASPAVFLAVAVFFTVIGLAQALLLGGKYPRAASILVGAALLPIEIIAFYFYWSRSMGHGYAPDELATVLVLGSVFGIPLGAVSGYLAGCLAAGMFCLADLYEKKRQSHAAPEAPEPDPLGRSAPAVSDRAAERAAEQVSDV